jgi:hypothetical protein
MKIITRGIVPEEKAYTAQCNNCKSVLEYNDKDVDKTKNIYRTYQGLMYKVPVKTILCPVCNRNIIL